MVSENTNNDAREGGNKPTDDSESHSNKTNGKPSSSVDRPHAETKNNDANAPNKMERVTLTLALVAAVASAASAFFSRESYVAVQRPFVTAKTLQITKDLPFQWHFNIVFRNSGNTPTQDMQYTVNLNCDLAHQRDPEDDFRDPLPNGLPQHWHITLGPQTETSLPFGTEIGLPFSVIDQMAKNRSFCMINGVIHYWDSFTIPNEHVSKFCYAIGAITRENTSVPTYSQCIYWNCADKDCERDNERYQTELHKLNPQLAK